MSLKIGYIYIFMQWNLYYTKKIQKNMHKN